MDLSGFAIVAEELIVHVSHHGYVTYFFDSSALEVLILNGILDNLALWINLVRKEVRKWDSGRSGLLRCGRLLTLLLVSLFLLLVRCSH